MKRISTLFIFLLFAATLSFAQAPPPPPPPLPPGTETPIDNNILILLIAMTLYGTWKIKNKHAAKLN